MAVRSTVLYESRVGLERHRLRKVPDDVKSASALTALLWTVDVGRGDDNSDRSQRRTSERKPPRSSMSKLLGMMESKLTQVWCQ